MNLKQITLIVLQIFILHFHLIAHEEPAKSLYEKNKKTEAKQRIFNSGIQSVTLYKLSENEAGRSKLMTMNYGTDGTYLSVEAYVDDHLNLKVEYGYSGKGDMISDSDFDHDGVLTEKNIFRYDKQGRVVSGKSYDRNELSGTFRFIHSKDKKEILFKNFSSDKNPEYALVYIYQRDFDLQDYSEVKKIRPDGTVEMTVTKDYNQLDQVVRKSIFGSDGKLSYYFEYFYDNLGNNIKISRHDPEGDLLKFDIFFHDPQGNITQQESYNHENELVSVIIYEFNYWEK